MLLFTSRIIMDHFKKLCYRLMYSEFTIYHDFFKVLPEILKQERIIIM